MHEQEDLFLELNLKKRGEPPGSPVFIKYSSRNKSSCSCIVVSDFTARATKSGFPRWYFGPINETTKLNFN